MRTMTCMMMMMMMIMMTIRVRLVLLHVTEDIKLMMRKRRPMTCIQVNREIQQRSPISGSRRPSLSSMIR